MKRKFYLRIVAIAAMLCTHALFSFGQKGFFQSPSNTRMDLPKIKTIEKYSVYNLKTSNLASYLLRAPLESKSKTAPPLALEIPLPDGATETFNVYETQLILPEMAAKYPEIKTYTGNGTTNKESVISISLTSLGFNAIILNLNGDAVYFEKLPGQGETYYNYFVKDVSVRDGGIRCDANELDVNSQNKNVPTSTNRIAAASQILTYRIAMASKAEFTVANGGTKASGFAALVQYFNRLNINYRIELGVQFTLVSTDNLVFLDPATDPYPNDEGASMDANQTLLDATIGSGNYDLGAVLNQNPPFTTPGGSAIIGAVCSSDSKAKAVLAFGDPAIVPQTFNDRVMLHEIGHLFSMTHSYNSNLGSCMTREQGTSVEPGMGVSLMSYAFICETDNYYDFFETGVDASVMNFHSVSRAQALAYIAAHGCATSAESTNLNEPVINSISTNHTIPKSTPFALTAAATDADNDPITYSWEGTNIGALATPDASVLEDNAVAPFFRTYAPTTNPTRTYPLLSAILDGTNKARGDKLPSTGVVTTHSLTVRDNHASAGRIALASVNVTVDGTAGPFQITSNLSGSYVVGTSQTITWDVAFTDNATINCTLVDIFLSIDGGQTWLAPLATATANDGSESVTFPNNATTQGRIKIAPHSINVARLGNNARVQAHTANIFFDISNTDFTITAAMPVTLTSFNATLKGKNNALLTWKTATETNNAGFDIEMSSDAKAFVRVGFVDGNGDSKETNQYRYTVSDLTGGRYYFRLKQLDYDGKFEYSTLRSLEIANADNIVLVYPNPTNGKLKFNSGVYKNETLGVKILNQAGQEVMALPANTKLLQGSELDVTHLATGLYHIKIEGKSFTETLKFVKM